MIFHVDVNSAFLSWSAVKRLSEDPNAVDLRTIPSAVGGDIATRHGIITAKSIPAKKYGIQTGEPVTQALNKCPELVLVPSDFQTYRKYSHAFIDILKKHADVVEQLSIDEAFLLIEKESKENSDAPWYIRKARQIKDEIRDTLGFTVNVGISENRLLAKMASDFSKPDKIHTLFPEEIPEKMWPLPIGELYGCGKKSAEKLISLGIFTIGDAAHADLAVLKAQLGEKAGEYIHKSANGIGSGIVTDVREKAKSYSNETTTSEDITADNYERMAPEIVHELADHVSRRLKRDHVRAGTVTVSVKTAEFKRHSRQKALSFQTNELSEIETCAQNLLRQLLLEPGGLFDQGQGIRLIGVGTSGLDDGEFTQVSLFDWAAEKKEIDAARVAEEEKRRKEAEERVRQERDREEEEQRRRVRDEKRERLEKLDAMMQKVQKRFGKDAIRKGKKENGE